MRESQDAPVEVAIPPTVTEWGDALFQALAGAVGLASVERVWIIDEGNDDADAQEYTNPKHGWEAIKQMGPDDIVLVAPPATSHMGTYIAITHCADIFNEDRTVRLTLGIVTGTDSVLVERRETDETGAMKRVMVRTIGGAQHEVSDDATRPLGERYIEMLRKQYGFVTIRRHLEPLVKGFDCITSKGEADSFGVLSEQEWIVVQTDYRGNETPSDWKPERENLITYVVATKQEAEAIEKRVNDQDQEAHEGYGEHESGTHANSFGPFEKGTFTVGYIFDDYIPLLQFADSVEETHPPKHTVVDVE